MEQLRGTNNCKHLSYNKNKYCTKFENHWTKYKATNPVCLNTVLECHYCDMTYLQQNENTRRHENLYEGRQISYNTNF